MLFTASARRAATFDLIAQVVNGYLRLRKLDERFVLARQIIASHLESFRIFRRRIEAGSTLRLDLPLVETLLQQALGLGGQLFVLSQPFEQTILGASRNQGMRSRQGLAMMLHLVGAE